MTRLRLKIKEVLAQKQMTQSTLSHVSFISLNTIQEITHNPYRDVKLSTLDKIAQALDVPITELYERLDE
jgi:DNA-binding Xre family transcriptional regulator